MLLIIAPDSRSISFLISSVTVNSTEVASGVTFYNATYGAVNFAAVVSGYGKVNIARAITMAQQRFAIDSILGIGTAGSVAACSVPVFSAIVPAATLQYDVDFTPLCYAAATLPGMTTGAYTADAAMTAALKTAAAGENVVYTEGIMASGDAFVADNFKRRKIRERYSAAAVDAEAGAIGQVAYFLGIPFAVIKAVSNSASCDAARQYRMYSDEAERVSQRVALRYLTSLGL